MKTLNEYKISAELAQAVVSLINELPSRVGRRLLNELESSFARQDAEFAEKLEQQKIEEIKKTMQESGNDNGSVHPA